MKGHERRTKSTVLPLTKNKNHQSAFAFNIQLFLPGKDEVLI